VLDGNPIWKTDALGNSPNEYEKDAKTGITKQTGTKGGDETDHITVKNDPGTSIGNIQIRPGAADYTYSVPVQTITYGDHLQNGPDGQPMTEYRALGQRVLASWSDRPINGPVCYECLFIPLPKGLQLFGRGTGMIGATAKTGRILGGASRSINYYTKAAEAAGYSTELSGSRVAAGLFVQASHNVRNIFTGRSLKILYSNSEATVVARAWQNQAIGLGALNIGTSIGTGIYNLTPQSQDHNTGGIGLSGSHSVPTIDNLSHR